MSSSDLPEKLNQGRDAGQGLWQSGCWKLPSLFRRIRKRQVTLLNDGIYRALKD